MGQPSLHILTFMSETFGIDAWFGRLSQFNEFFEPMEGISNLCELVVEDRLNPLEIEFPL